MAVLRSALSIGLFAFGLCTCARERGDLEHPRTGTSTRSTRHGSSDTGKPIVSGSVASSAGCSDEDLTRRAHQVLRGFASYYADSLSGNPTASGVRYDPDLYSAAHRTLPFGTRLRVTRTDEKAEPVCVTVNDRGPFRGKRRIIDLSRRAAEALNMRGLGVVPVRVEVL